MIEEILVTFDILTYCRIVNVRLDLQGLQVCLDPMEEMVCQEKAYKDLLVHQVHQVYPEFQAVTESKDPKETLEKSVQMEEMDIQDLMAEMVKREMTANPANPD